MRRRLWLLVAGLALQACLARQQPGITRALPTAPMALTPSIAIVARPSATLTVSPTPTKVPTSTPSPTATVIPLTATVSLDPTIVTQGRVAVICVIASRPCQLMGTFGDRELGFVAEEAAGAPYVYTAYVGVHALASAKPESIALVARSIDGLQHVTLRAALTVADGGYDSERIPLAPETQRLLDPKLTEPENARVNAVYAGFTPRRYWRGPFVWPLQGPITSQFGTRRQYGSAPPSGFHTGLDIDGETGDAIMAAADGVVALAEMLQVRGGTVIIDHGAGVYTSYQHLHAMRVSPGEHVSQGAIIGAMGTTGLSTGSHLHWEMRVGGIAVDPLQWLVSDSSLNGG